MTSTFSIADLDFLTADLDIRLAEASKVQSKLQQDFLDQAVPVDMVGQTEGPVHAASLQIWNEVARLAGVPYVSAELIADIPMDILNDDIFSWNDVTIPLDPIRHASIIAARDYAKSGGFWRTDLCSPSWVKAQLSETGSFETETSFSLDDPRIVDLHYGLPSIQILARPLLTPVRIGDWPVEFRVFFGGEIEADGAVSFYYPQAGDFTVTPELEAAAKQAQLWGTKLYQTRQELGLTPWLPPAAPAKSIGATIDFMLTEEMGLVMIDAGPRFGHGAHPCCFIDAPIDGIQWKLEEGVKLRSFSR